MTSLNPVQRIGHQITEPLKIHLELSKTEAKETALSLLMQVGIPSPVERYDAYPAQLSGGMRQRVMIAIALACAPRLLMADEPTTGLDVTVQAQILDLLSTLQRDREMAMVLVTHDLGVVATRTDEIIVMYAGNVVERRPDQRLVQEHGHAVHRGAAQVDAAHRQPQPHPLDGHRGSPARPVSPARRLPVLPPLPLRPGPVPPREAAARPRRRPGTATPAGSPYRPRRTARRRWRCDRHRPLAPTRCSPSKTSTSRSTRGARPCRRWRASPSPCARARPSAWSASPGAASRRQAAPSCRWSGPTSGTDPLRRHRAHRAQPRRPAHAAHAGADDLPGPRSRRSTRGGG